jgi:hypothetical protein
VNCTAGGSNAASMNGPHAQQPLDKGTVRPPTLDDHSIARLCCKLVRQRGRTCDGSACTPEEPASLGLEAAIGQPITASAARSRASWQSAICVSYAPAHAPSSEPSHLEIRREPPIKCGGLSDVFLPTACPGRRVQPDCVIAASLGPKGWPASALSPSIRPIHIETLKLTLSGS